MHTYIHTLSWVGARRRPEGLMSYAHHGQTTWLSELVDILKSKFCIIKLCKILQSRYVHIVKVVLTVKLIKLLSYLKFLLVHSVDKILKQTKTGQISRHSLTCYLVENCLKPLSTNLRTRWLLLHGTIFPSWTLAFTWGRSFSLLQR